MGRPCPDCKRLGQWVGAQQRRLVRSEGRCVMRGHVRLRGQRWYIVVDVRDATTQSRRRKWISTDCEGRREAQLKCAAILVEMQGGATVNPSKITLDQFLDRFEADWASVHVSAQTFERYRSALQPVRRALGGR